MSFLALYISVHSLCLIICYPLFVLCLILSSPSLSTLVSSIFILFLRRPYLSILYNPYEPFPIVQINPILTTPTLV